MIQLIKTNKKTVAVVLVLLLLSFGTGFWLQTKDTDAGAEVQYEQVQVKRDDIIVSFDSDGSIELAKVNLRFGVKGTISEILVAEGDEVAKGDVIAKLDSRDYQDQYQLAQIKLTDSQEQQITSQLDSELRLLTTEADLQRIKDEYEEMVMITDAYSANQIKMKEMELASKELEYQNMLKKYELQKDQGLEQDQLQVKMARDNLENTVLYAPVTGNVLGLFKKVGERVSDEQDFATIHENNAVKAVTKVIEYDIGDIKVGQKVYVQADALPDQKFSGVVSKVDSLPVADNADLVNYTVEIDLTEPSPALKDGMTCMVSFVIKDVLDCLIVPYRAVKIVDGKQMVTVLDENGELVEKQIKTGFSDGTSVEVLDGLRVNETVVYRVSR